jgi:hypothetical protein
MEFFRTLGQSPREGPASTLGPLGQVEQAIENVDSAVRWSNGKLPRLKSASMDAILLSNL